MPPLRVGSRREEVVGNVAAIVTVSSARFAESHGILEVEVGGTVANDDESGLVLFVDMGQHVFVANQQFFGTDRIIGRHIGDELDGDFQFQVGGRQLADDVVEQGLTFFIEDFVRGGALLFAVFQVFDELEGDYTSDHQIVAIDQELVVVGVVFDVEQPVQGIPGVSTAGDDSQEGSIQVDVGVVLVVGNVARGLVVVFVLDGQGDGLVVVVVGGGVDRRGFETGGGEGCLFQGRQVVGGLGVEFELVDVGHL